MEVTEYKCDICGKIDFWADGWISYSSLNHEDFCPCDIPNACSDECGKELMKKIKAKEFVLPQLSDYDEYNMHVTKKRSGY